MFESFVCGSSVCFFLPPFVWWHSYKFIELMIINWGQIIIQISTKWNYEIKTRAQLILSVSWILFCFELKLIQFSGSICDELSKYRMNPKVFFRASKSLFHYKKFQNTWINVIYIHFCQLIFCPIQIVPFQLFTQSF